MLRSKIFVIPLFEVFSFVLMLSVAGAVEPRPDYSSLVKSLANNNPRPRILGEIPDLYPVFPKDFDWIEQARVVAAVKQLVSHPDDAWPALLSGLDDNRYSLTIAQRQSVVTFSVSKLCSEILREAILAAYTKDIPPYKSAYLRLSWPHDVSYRKFGDWVKEQSTNKRELWELQANAAAWASKEVHDVDVVPADLRLAAARRLQAIATDVRNSRRSVPIKSFFHEGRGVFSEEEYSQLQKHLPIPCNGNDRDLKRK